MGNHSNFVDCEFFLESNSAYIIALCGTNLGDSIDSGIFSVRGQSHLPLIGKDSAIDMHGLTVYVMTSFCTGPISRKLYQFLCMFSTGFISLSILLLFSVSITFSVKFHPTSANVFVFGDFNVHHKDWLTYSGGTDRPGELCYNFSISNDLTQMVNFPTRIPDCDSHSLALLDLFLSSDVICSTMWFSLHLEILFALIFHQIHNRISCFIA